MDTNRKQELENAIMVGTKYTQATCNPGVSFDESQRVYTDYALVYDETLDTLGRRSHNKVAEYVAASFKDHEYADVKILDVGAGTGLVGQELKRRGFVHVDALEPNECMLNKARERCAYENYFMDYLSDEPSCFTKDSYDVVTGCGIFAESAHVPCKALHVMANIVKPGGYIILANRLSVLQRDGEAKHMESFIEQMECDRKWKKIACEQFLYNEANQQPGMIWKFQVI